MRLALAFPLLSLALLAPSTALADDPPAAPGASPGHVYTPPGYREPAEGASAAPVAPALPPWMMPPEPPEYPPLMVRRSPYMMLGGVLLMSFGTVGLVAGSALLTHPKSSNPIIEPGCPDCGGRPTGGVTSAATNPTDDPARTKAGIGALIGGGIAFLAGIPLVAIGSKEVPLDAGAPPKAAARPITVSALPGGAAITLRF
jgi:hypothetical protein